MRGTRIVAVLLLGCLNLTVAKAFQNKGYPVGAIPANLTGNASVVVRFSEMQVEISGPGSMKIKYREARTILRESGVSASELNVGYNSLMRVGSISGAIYDSGGNRVRNIKSDEIKDFLAYDGFSIYSDARVKTINPKYYNYPFTVEYQYELTFKTALYLPSFYIFRGYETSVESAVYQLTAPADFPVHYMEFNGMDRCNEAGTAGRKTYSWKYGNFAAKRQEPFSADPVDQYPYVLIAPGEYSIEGFSGKMETWTDYGSFFYRLLEGKQTLPEATVHQIRSLVSGIENDLDKIKAVYRYSQTKNRYVSIQEGIGGIVPIDASTVDRFSYGDCKALSNYVMSLLRIAGIESYYTLVYAGERNRPVRSDMVTDYFNHVILCVPLNGDTVWLECTNPYTPVNYLGSFTDDRFALLISSAGGTLVKTPAYNHYGNSAVVTSDIRISADGNASVSQSGIYSGTCYGDQHSLLLMDEKDRQKALLRQIPVSDISVRKYDFVTTDGEGISINKTVEYDAFNCVTLTGDMLMFRQSLVSGSVSVPAFARRRDSPVVIERDYMQVDSTCFHIPAGYLSGVIPTDTILGNDMLECSFRYYVDGDRLIIVRRFMMNKGAYDAARFNELRDLLGKIAQRDNERIVLRK